MRLILATDQSSISEDRRPPAVSLKTETLAGREFIDGVWDGVMGVEQHGGGLGLQTLDQHALEAGDLIPRGFGGAQMGCNRVFNRRALVHGGHFEDAVFIRHAPHAP